ncbi:solute carrier family 66 member 3-like [Diadema setosum]|uniref:solute carrier family 66 member 3-like n=1 Tax=Diadema setosum TaxID=31175 RepID=UPI003B3B82E8
MSASMDTSNAVSVDNLLRFLNFFCVAPCLFAKVPQMRNVIVARSAKGLSFNGALMETVVYMVGLLYHFTNLFPVMAFAEYIALEIQALLMVLLIVYYSDNLEFRLIPMAAVFFTLAGLIGAGVFPAYVIAFLFSCNMPLNASSKLLNFSTIYRAKNSGSASFTMWLVLGLTSIGRVVTTVLTKPDYLLITNFTVSGALNFLVCGAILYYRPSEKKFE